MNATVQCLKNVPELQDGLNRLGLVLPSPFYIIVKVATDIIEKTAILDFPEKSFSLLFEYTNILYVFLPK